MTDKIVTHRARQLQRYRDVVKRYKNNELSLAQAANELHRTGLYRSVNAWNHIEGL